LICLKRILTGDWDPKLIEPQGKQETTKKTNKNKKNKKKNVGTPKNIVLKIVAHYHPPLNPDFGFFRSGRGQ
jgi:hypothetical protein